MKDGVVRWNAVQNLNENKNKNKNQNQNISIKNRSGKNNVTTNSDYNIVYTHVADNAVPQHVAHDKQRTLLINACHSAKTDTLEKANDCDKNENIHKNSSSFLVHKRNRPKLYEILDNISFSRRFLINSKRHNQEQHSTRTLFGINNLYKILLICLQFSAVVFLCNLNVGFALAAKLDESSVELGFDEVFDGNSNSLSNSGSAKHFTHTWAVHIPNADDETAHQVARDHGFVNMGKSIYALNGENPNYKEKLPFHQAVAPCRIDNITLYSHLIVFPYTGTQELASQTGINLQTFSLL
ncbi:furin-like protease 1 [Teleopsis dalmanni]|uniref:furin-like protease 1 n=1 Tax=Teleopsis dalmanni TaxID=139649 RepID=UPI0018CDAF6A|nr:furin-like protease 1 [Teleopsis dalmanni]